MYTLDYTMDDVRCVPCWLIRIALRVKLSNVFQNIGGWGRFRYTKYITFNALQIIESGRSDFVDCGASCVTIGRVIFINCKFHDETPPLIRFDEHKSIPKFLSVAVMTKKLVLLVLKILLTFCILISLKILGSKGQCRFVLEIRK